LIKKQGLWSRYFLSEWTKDNRRTPPSPYFPHLPVFSTMDPRPTHVHQAQPSPIAAAASLFPQPPPVYHHHQQQQQHAPLESANDPVKALLDGIGSAIGTALVTQNVIDVQSVVVGMLGKVYDDCRRQIVQPMHV
jgi:hypothetical protein